MAKIIFNDEEVNEFLRQSNAIEGEYSEEAFWDSRQAWDFAVKKMEANKPINIEFIKNIHLRIMRGLYLEIAGKIRKKPIWVGSPVKGFNECLDPKKIHEELRQLCNPGLFPYYLGAEYIKQWHIKFENIHPFSDGNGRTGRIIMNIQRLKIGLPLLIIHTGKEQQEYYKWFKTK